MGKSKRARKTPRNQREGRAASQGRYSSGSRLSRGDKKKTKISDRAIPIFVTGFLLAGVGIIVAQSIWPKGTATPSVTVPTLSALAAEGRTAFDANCAECHGPNAAGTKKGPPLVHDLYNPGHHADAAIFRAVKKGVPQHHWPYGNMPPRPGVSDKQIAAIVRYVRELQEANGIFYRPHRM